MSDMVYAVCQHGKSYPHPFPCPEQLRFGDGVSCNVDHGTCSPRPLGTVEEIERWKVNSGAFLALDADTFKKAAAYDEGAEPMAMFAALLVADALDPYDVGAIEAIYGAGFRIVREVEA